MKKLIIHSSLKDSFQSDGKLTFGFLDESYAIPYQKFIINLSRRTSRALLTSEYKILNGASGEETQLRAVIMVPPDWAGPRFLEEALKEWTKNPSADLVIEAYIA